jgi:type IV fimbrial biogenesis protein FimT
MSTPLSTLRRRVTGFTLMELMLTLTVAAVLAAVAIPNMRDFIRNNRLTSASNDLLRSFQVARSEAVKRQRVVAVCASANAADDDAICSNGAFSGWIVFVDENNNWDRDPADADEVVISRGTVDAGVSVVNDNSGVVSYAGTGFANATPGQTPTSRVVVCDARGAAIVGANSVARAVLIDATGRSRVARDGATVTNTLAGIGETCP